ncbi:MAG TPA: electron transfer flavoprotein subunit alpha/FixB family protein [Candidatus Limnocylindria bacterium]|nr:electron transfer flavoprotein subunit alpha/FixB family protein [Candidatus Limnocylindria bacterium]
MNVLVIVEKKDGEPRRVSLEIAAKAEELGTVTAVDVGGDRLDPGAAASALAERAKAADLVLVGATPFGRDLAARLAAALGRVYASEVADLEAEGDGLVAVRTMYAGKVRATVRLPLPAVASVRANAFPLPEGGAPPKTETVHAGGAQKGVEFVRFEAAKESGGRVPLTEARAIVSAGRGLKGPENWKMIEELADVLGAAIGASRAVTDAGWRPNEEQVGQTGKTVTPDLYVALGISGAIQHLAGMSGSKVIVAVNKDPDADIFKIADYGVVGDLFEFVPAFTEELKKVKKGA